MINSLDNIIRYAIKHDLIKERDFIYSKNRLSFLLKIENPNSDKLLIDESKIDTSNIDEVLKPLLEIAKKNNIIESTHPDYADIFDTEIMSIFTPTPSIIEEKFNSLYKKNYKLATDYLYNLSIASNYVRMNRIKKNIKWSAYSEYGKLNITINLSKPEKDPKAIAAEKDKPKSSYPSCLLCKENEGFAFDNFRQARQNLRMVEIKLNNEVWHLQYSPYIYYPEHSIILSSEHRPMVINEKTFSNLLNFLDMFPHYFIGSNTDIPIVGGSILSHDHYQAGVFEFPINIADIMHSINYDDIKISLLKWPLNVLRLKSENKESIIKLSVKILEYWKKYNNHNLGIYSNTADIRHNAITPIARKNNGFYEMDLALRNNMTSDEHPLGIFHPHADKHHIKQENIGLIEVMGLAILPGRLLEELNMLKKLLLENKIEEIKNNTLTCKHYLWSLEILKKYKINSNNIDEIFNNEIAEVFCEVLKDCGVFKNNDDFKTFALDMTKNLS